MRSGVSVTVGTTPKGPSVPPTTAPSTTDAKCTTTPASPKIVSKSHTREHAKVGETITTEQVVKFARYVLYSIAMSESN